MYRSHGPNTGSYPGGGQIKKRPEQGLVYKTLRAKYVYKIDSLWDYAKSETDVYVLMGPPERVLYGMK